MEFITFLRAEPVIGWFMFLAIMLIVVSVASVLWVKIAGRKPDEVAEAPMPATRSRSFGNQTDLVILFIGLLLAVVVIALIRGIFWG
jgi:hypothetical protein